MLELFHFPFFFPLREISIADLSEKYGLLSGYQKFKMDFELHPWKATYYDDFDNKKQRKMFQAIIW
jgi:hypothetical protein